MTDAEFVRELALPLSGAPNDYDELLDLIGDARIVLLGEASHGTHEFYFERAEISKRLIAEKNFTVIALEADWPDAARVHRYVRGASDDKNASEALAGYRRFPTWMWRNTVVVDFVEWLRDFNQRLERAIGVIYRPESERLSHYFHARLPKQFDAMIHIDETRAVEPLERTSVWDKGELPETYPFKV